MEMDREELAVEVSRLEDEHGVVTPRRMVDAARPRSHPLHSLFEWDDGTAGDNYRLAQARALIRSIRVEYVRGEVRTFAPKYVHVPQEDKSQSYRAVTVLRDDRTAARTTALRELAYARASVERARSVASALDFDDLFDALMTSLETLHERVAAVEATQVG